MKASSFQKDCRAANCRMRIRDPASTSAMASAFQNLVSLVNGNTLIDGRLRCGNGWIGMPRGARTGQNVELQSVLPAQRIIHHSVDLIHADHLHADVVIAGGKAMVECIDARAAGQIGANDFASGPERSKN